VTRAWEGSRTGLATVRSPHLPDEAPKAALALWTSKNWPQTALGILLYGPQYPQKATVFSSPASAAPGNIPSHEQQLRTDLEPCRLCRFTIDFETDPVSLQAKPDHSARGEEIICFSHC
jgi:hypothetical protein